MAKQREISQQRRSKRKPVAVIVIHSGVVMVSRKPRNLTLIIKDYDIQEKSRHTQKDGSGKPFNESRY